MSPRIGELFAGYGGLGMGVQAVYGGELAWVSDYDKGPSSILGHRFPGVPNHGDITAVDWSRVEPVDILTGGSPCQDLSSAGRRAGMVEGTRSNLWAAMREVIATIRPSLVVWENVRGAYSAAAASALEHCAGCMGDTPDRGPVLRALGRVLGDLSDLGYDARWHGVRASDVGAPHARFRVFVTAYAVDRGRDGWSPESQRVEEPRATAAGPRVDLLPSPRTSDTNGAGLHGDGGLDLRTAVSLLPTPVTRDTSGAMRDRLASSGYGPALRDAPYLDWGRYAAAVQRWEDITRPAPPPTEVGPHGATRLAPAFSEWMMGLPAGWVTDVPGITRRDALRAIGNGVVPQQAEHALRAMAAWGTDSCHAANDMHSPVMEVAR